VTVQPDITSLTSPFIALKSERREESFYTICEVTGRRDGVIELLVKNGNYPADLTISDGVCQLTVSPRGGDERFAGYAPWPSSLEWHGSFPKSVDDLDGMQEHVAREIADGAGCAIPEPAELAAAI
jgi:hypothetical protein